MAGVLMSVPPIDFQVHNSLFLIAHFHSVIIGGVVFGFFAGYTYWFPKFTGFKLDEKLGKYAFVCWFIGFLAAFLPLYALGLMGATRRLDHYQASTGWQPLFIVAAFGVFLIMCGIGFQVLQLITSIKRKDRDTTGDPWNGRTLEWSTSSPPPYYNFAKLPIVTEIDDYWFTKHSKIEHKEEVQHFEMPKNTSSGLIISAFSFILAFAMVWHIFWLAGVGLLGVIVSLIIRLSDDDIEYELEVKG